MGITLEKVLEQILETKKTLEYFAKLNGASDVCDNLNIVIGKLELLAIGISEAGEKREN